MKGGACLLSVSYVKFCPQCKTTNNVDTTACVKCGHKFRTHFEAPVSEKTVAMTGDVLAQFAPGAEAGIPVPPPTPIRRRPRPGRRLAFAALCVVLAGAALRFGSHVARSGDPVPVRPPAAQAAAFRPYDVVFHSDAQGLPVPLATQSPDDLGRYKPDGADTASVGLYRAGRIVLVYPGTLAQVIEENATWRHVTLQSGAHQGASGYVGAASVERPADAPQNPADLLAPPPPVTKS